MLARIALVCLVVAAAPAIASPAIEIHASCAAELAADPFHVRTLRAELAQELEGAAGAHAQAIDITLVRLDATTSGTDVVVRAEVRALISDHGRVTYTATSHTTARGPIRERLLVQRDAIAGAARDVGRHIKARR